MLLLLVFSLFSCSVLRWLCLISIGSAIYGIKVLQTHLRYASYKCVCDKKRWKVVLFQIKQINTIWTNKMNGIGSSIFFGGEVEKGQPWVLNIKNLMRTIQSLFQMNCMLEVAAYFLFIIQLLYYFILTQCVLLCQLSENETFSMIK